MSWTALTDNGRQGVPAIVGVPIGLLTGLVLTYVATGQHVAAPDGVHYTDEGPCPDAVRTGETTESDTQFLLDVCSSLLFRGGADSSPRDGALASLRNPDASLQRARRSADGERRWSRCRV